MYPLVSMKNINLNKAGPNRVVVFPYYTLMLAYHHLLLKMLLLSSELHGEGEGCWVCYQMPPGRLFIPQSFRCIIYETGTRKTCVIYPTGLS